MKTATSTLLTTVTADLQAAASSEFQVRQQGYSKEAILSLGVRTPAVRAIAKTHFPAVKSLPIDAFLGECEAFLQAGTVEHRCVAFAWAFQRKRDLQPAHFDVLLRWLAHYVQDWAACDQLCCEVFGAFLIRYPAFAPAVRDWARSDNRWLRRAAAVILIPDLRKTAQFAALVFEVATTLLPDRDDLVQKGYGWALKELMDKQPQETWAFILQHKSQMSRTALRYAIEKLSPAQKAEAMKS
jgi:3-methyladenine DNA glycosylase AlkD